MTQPLTILDVFDAKAQLTERGFTFLDYKGNADFWSFARLIEAARQRATLLRALDLAQGERVALMQGDVREFVLWFFGAIAAGLVPVPMYPLSSARASTSWLNTATRIMQVSEARVLLAERLPTELENAARELGVRPYLVSGSGGWSGEIQRLAEASASEVYRRPELQPDDLCFLQFTSGSTSSPKGVHVSHANLLANSHAIMIDGLHCDPVIDKPVCWLPLYHDMGLIGHVIAPLTIGMSVVFIPTLAFLTRPAIWMESVHTHGGTVVFGPNFALAHAARRATPEELARWDLSRLRVVGCGAEPIQADTLRLFLDTFSPTGLKPEAIMPCYGLAEATLAVSFDALDRPSRIVAIDRAAYENRGIAQPCATGAVATVELASCGRAFPGHEITIMNDDGEQLPESHVGEIAVRGPSITPGYFGDEQSSRSQRRGDWLLTGDRGFMLDNELFVSGRKKDLLIVDGRNYDPQALEWAVEEIPAVRQGGVCAFSVAGGDTEAVVVVAETRQKHERDALMREIRQRLRTSVGVLPSDVLLVLPGQLPKTSSGKLQRQRAKHMYTTGAFVKAQAPLA
jgi:fatty-acyl-CoA synthase